MIGRLERPLDGPAPPRCFRETGAAAGVAPDQRVDAELGAGAGKGPRLVCRLCHGPVTSRGDAIEVEGRHQHTFFNPAGMLFEIGCFGAAPGCRVSGQPTAEFAWFAGYRWQYASCRSCDAHLGWFFSGGAGHAFHGLIVARLVEEERSAAPE
jgi:hypothetical protein